MSCHYKFLDNRPKLNIVNRVLRCSIYIVAMLLTQRQQQELNKAVLQYLEPILEEQPEVLSSLKQVLITNNDEVIANYLEKKWSTVLRLQKKIIDLENELNGYRTAQPDTAGISKDKINWLPSVAGKSYHTQSSQIVNSVAIHPYLPSVLAGCSDGLLISWNLADPSIPDKIIKAHTRAVNCIRWSSSKLEISNSKQYVFASCSADLTIKIYDGSSYNNIRTLTGHDHTISSIKFSPVKPQILYSVSRDRNVKIWDVISGYCIKSFIGHSDWVRDIDVTNVNSKLSFNAVKQSNLGDFLLTCSNDHSIRLSHAESGTGLALLIGHTHVVETVKFLPFLSNDHIDPFLKENYEQFAIPKDLISNKDYTELLGYKYCITGGRDNKVKIWLLPPPIIPAHRHPLPAKINNSQGWMIAELTQHSSWLKTITIHPNGRFIFTGSDDKTLKVWDLSTLSIGGRVRCVKTLSSTAFINDSDFAGFNIDTPADKEIDSRQILQLIESNMRSLFVSGGSDNKVTLWS